MGDIFIYEMDIHAKKHEVVDTFTCIREKNTSVTIRIIARKISISVVDQVTSIKTIKTKVTNAK